MCGKKLIHVREWCDLRGVWACAASGRHEERILLVSDNWHDVQEIEATVVDRNGTETGHIIATTIGGRNGQPKQV